MRPRGAGPRPAEPRNRAPRRPLRGAARERSSVRFRLAIRPGAFGASGQGVCGTVALGRSRPGAVISSAWCTLCGRLRLAGCSTSRPSSACWRLPYGTPYSLYGSTANNGPARSEWTRRSKTTGEARGTARDRLAVSSGWNREGNREWDRPDPGYTTSLSGTDGRAIGDSAWPAARAARVPAAPPPFGRSRRWRDLFTRRASRGRLRLAGSSTSRPRLPRFSACRATRSISAAAAAGATRGTALPRRGNGAQNEAGLLSRGCSAATPAEPERAARGAEGYLRCCRRCSRSKCDAMVGASIEPAQPPYVVVGDERQRRNGPRRQEVRVQDGSAHAEDGVRSRIRASLAQYRLLILS